MEIELKDNNELDVPFKFILCNRFSGLMIFTVVIAILCFFYFEPVLAINLVNYGMSTSDSGLGFAAIAFTFMIGCPLLGWLSTVYSRTIIINLSMVIISISVFLIGPVSFLPDKLWIVFTGLFLVGFGAAGILAPSVPEIVESSIEKFKFDRQERGDPSLTEN
jgi:MFS family permease